MEAQTKTQKQRTMLKHGSAPLVAQGEGERWVLLKVPRCDIDGVGEVK